MSEQAPRTNPRLENFEANKAAKEREAFEAALYADAGTHDFSDTARKRVEEADAYEQQLERLAGDDRSAEDRTLDLAESSELQSNAELMNDWDVAIAENAVVDSKKDAEKAALLESDPRLRRMAMIAGDIAQLRNRLLTPETADSDVERLNDLEDKLQDLLVSYEQTEGSSEVLSDILNLAFADPTDVPQAEQESHPDKPADTTNDPSEITDGAAPDDAPEASNDVVSESETSTSGAEEQTPSVDELNERADAAITSFDAMLKPEEQTAEPSHKRRFIDGLKRILRDDQFANNQLPKTSEKSLDERADNALSEFDKLIQATAEKRASTRMQRAQAALNGSLTKLYYGIGRTYNERISGKSKKDDETDQEYEARMKRNGEVASKVAVGVIAVGTVLVSAYKISKGMQSGSSSAMGGEHASHLMTAQLDTIDTPDQTPSVDASHAHEILNSNAWDIPKDSGGGALMDRLNVDKSVWYQHQDEFLKQFPDEAYRMRTGNVGFDDPGKLSKGAIEFWAKKTGKW